MDYLLLWWKSEGDLKMSRQDLQDELKQTEGNPASKARIRRLQRQSRRKQMLKAAETATVVITNPTHYAVALRYEPNMAAPIVVAKGLDILAAKIKEIAWKLDIPVMENRPLAQALYKSVEVGDPIPSALYHAVAEILVLIYKAQAEVRNREARRQENRCAKNHCEAAVNIAVNNKSGSAEYASRILRLDHSHRSGGSCVRDAGSVAEHRSRPAAHA